MKKICGIYKITNPKDKIYIGQTINWKNRHQQYKCLSSSIKKQPKLYNSLKKYGYENHVFEIIEECDLNLLNEKERYWQDFYEVISKKGLNCRLTLTEDKSGVMSDDSKHKKSESMKKYWENNPRVISEEHMLKMINGRKGLTRNETTKQKMRDKKIGKTYRNKPILQFDLNGNFIKEWESIKKAKDWLGKGDIHSCCIGKQKTAGGFVWKYKK